MHLHPDILSGRFRKITGRLSTFMDQVPQFYLSFRTDGHGESSATEIGSGPTVNLGDFVRVTLSTGFFPRREWGQTFGRSEDRTTGSYFTDSVQR